MILRSFPKVGIVNYSTGNIHSVTNALDRIGSDHTIVREPQDLKKCDALIMPGVGHFHTAIQSLIFTGLDQAIYDSSSTGLPILGICLGFQLLTQSSDESPHESGLGLFPTRTVRLDPDDTTIHKVPHIGWNSLETDHNWPIILKDLESHDFCFYFANKYAVLPMQAFSCDQALYKHEKSWVAAASSKNVFGVQFHPEKSGNLGEKLLLNFLAYA
jgi:glutamine amidotransferase